MPRQLIDVGRVTALFRHPVKSMAGESLAATTIGWHGIAGDRRFAFLRTNDRSELPWLTARQVPRLLLYAARLENPGAVERSGVVVKPPGCDPLRLDSAALSHELEDLAGEPLQLVHLGRGAFDSMALSLITTQSMEAISGLVGYDLEPQRFRPNIVIAAFDECPFPEDRWVDQLLVIGDRPDSARLRVNRLDRRCMVVNLDVRTAKQDSAILRAIVQQRQQLLGVYGSTERAGTVCVGDTVRMQIL